MNLCDGLFDRAAEEVRVDVASLPPSYRSLEEGSKAQGWKREREGGAVGANVDSNPSGGEPSTERFISTRPPPLQHPPIPPPLHVLPEFQPGELNSAAVSNILCSDSPPLPSFAACIPSTIS